MKPKKLFLLVALGVLLYACALGALLGPAAMMLRTLEKMTQSSNYDPLYFDPVG